MEQVACWTASIGHVQVVHPLTHEENADEVIRSLEDADHHTGDHVYYVVAATPDCTHCKKKF